MTLRRPGPVLAILLTFLPPAAAAAQALLSPPDWNMGRITAAAPVSRTLTVTNPGPTPLQVRLMSTCGCLEAIPSRVELAPAEARDIELRYTPDDVGKVSLYFVVTSTAPGQSRGSTTIYQVKGLVGAGEATAPPAPAAGQARASDLLFYYAPGCRSCERLIARLEARLAADASRRLVRRNILEPDAFEELAAFAGLSGAPAVPVLVAGGRVLAGEAAIEAGLEEALGAAGPAAPPVSQGEAGSIARSLAAPALLAAGLVDGINPCAFTTIVFLLTSLVLAGRRRIEILLVGCGFTFAVFATYFLVGLGLFHSLRAASSFPVVAAALRWLLIAVLLAFAAVSLYDYALARRGRATEMVLKLPDPIKRRMQRTILAGARSPALVGGSLVLGAAVSLFELACTGQVYFPAIAYLVRTGGGLASYLLLAVYNLGFITPLAIVFVLAWRGVSSRRLAELARTHVAAVKLSLAGVFVGLAALTLLT